MQMEEESAAAAVVSTLLGAVEAGDWPLAGEAGWALEMMGGWSRRLASGIGCAAGSGRACQAGWLAACCPAVLWGRRSGCGREAAWRRCLPRALLRAGWLC